MTEENISKKEAQELVQHINDQSSGVHSFLKSVIRSKDTTKTGNLKEEEIGIPKLSLRGIKELEQFSEEIAEEKEWAKYFRGLGEIQTSTSLSKEGIMLKLAVTQKKEWAEYSPQENKKKNRGWFKKGQTQQQPQQQ